MSLDMTPVHRNLHTKVTFLGLEFEDLILVLALAALMNLLAHFAGNNAHFLGMPLPTTSQRVDGRISGCRGAPDCSVHTQRALTLVVCYSLHGQRSAGERVGQQPLQGSFLAVTALLYCLDDMHL